MPGKIILGGTEGPIKGKVFTFQEHDTFIFGRDTDCHAQLSDDRSIIARSMAATLRNGLLKQTRCQRPPKWVSAVKKIMTHAPFSPRKEDDPKRLIG
jgi:hypothetical protein